MHSELLKRASRLAFPVIVAACGRKTPPDLVSPPAQIVLSNRDSARALLRGSLGALGARHREPTRTFYLRLDSRQQYWMDVIERRVLYDLDSPAPGDVPARASASQAPVFLAFVDRLVPHVALARAVEFSAASTTLLPATTRGGRTVLPVSYSDSGSSQPTTVEIDAKTLRPVAFAVGADRTELLDYRKVNGFRIPWHRRQFSAGVLVSEQRVVEVRLNIAIADSMFAIPAGYSVPPLDAR